MRSQIQRTEDGISAMILETAIKQPRKGSKGSKHEAASRKIMGMPFTCRVKGVCLSQPHSSPLILRFLRLFAAIPSPESRVMRGSVFAALLVVLMAGCSKAPTSDLRPPTSGLSPAPTPLHSNSVLRVHWAGKHSLGVAAGAYSLMRLWELPESKQLEAQLLGKLATAPWRLAATKGIGTSDGSAMLQTPLEDVVNKECFLEIRAGTNQAGQAVFAIRLDEKLATVWATNISMAVSSLEGGYPTRQRGGWAIKSARSAATFELVRTGEWTVLGRSQGANALMQETIARIEREGAPFAGATSHWLAADVDLNWASATFNIQHSTLNVEPGKGELPRVSLMITGDGANALTSGELVFAKPLPLDLDPWSFPARQIQEPVISLTAVRGIGSCLKGSKSWSDFKLGEAPNQVFTWADARAPLQMHLAAPTGNAAALAAALGGSFLTQGRSWLAKNGEGSLEAMPGAKGVVWRELPMISPFLGASGDGQWLLGGLIPTPEPATNAPPDVYPRPSLPELFADIARRTNLVAYAWETTGARAESFHFLGQILRVATRHAQMPLDCPTSQWLQAARRRLGNSTTVVTLAAPDRLAFERKSAIGVTAAELYLLADWLESPTFPRGFYTPSSPAAAP
jgi:hypothetical protein